MQRSPYAIESGIICLMACFALTAGCEDGPSDSYHPVPARASRTWNDSHPSDFADDAGQDFVVSTAGTNKNDLCTPDQLKAARSKYFGAPIRPPGIAAGLDIAGGPNGDGAAGYDPDKPFTYDPSTETWVGATVEDAEKVLCQGHTDTVFYGESNTVGWGDNDEVSVLYNVNSRIIEDVLIQVGYEGSIEADSVDGKTHYSIHFNNAPIVKTVKDDKGNAGQPQSMILDWTEQATLAKQVNDLYDALRNTFQPDFPADSNCVAAGHCILGNNYSAGGYMWFTPLNMSFFVTTTVGTDIANSAIVLLDLGKLKLLGFSSASTLLKLDSMGEGPLATRTNVWGQGVTCNYHLGISFGDFKHDCVEPFNDPVKNKTEENKLFGGMGHGDETYSFDVQGIDPQFAASSLPPDKVVADNDMPTDDDTSYVLRIDQEVLGPITNDYKNNDPTQQKDLHGIGLLTLEWANMIQHYMQKHYGVTTELGDSDCIANPMRMATGGKVCSGLEGIVTTAPPESVAMGMKPNALGRAIVADPATKGAFESLALGMKPGTWFSFFCSDGGGLDSDGHPVGYNAGAHHCYGQDDATHNGYYFDTVQYMVEQAYGGPESTPQELTDLRFYFQQWILSLIKYLRVADKPNATLADVDAQTVSLDDLFFDTAGGGFEFGEFIDRHSVSAAMQPPTNVQVTTNLLTSVINDFQFTRYTFRGETALYRALSPDPKAIPGATNLLLSNLVGSAVLRDTYGTYECAINKDPSKCGGMTGPADDKGTLLLDDDDRPLLTAYQDAFGASSLAIPELGAPAVASALAIKNIYTDFASAMIQLPRWSNPYDPSSAADNDPMVEALVPYQPKGSSVGFPVSVDGSRDKFVDTFNVDFSGVGITANVDYDYVYTKDGDKQLVVKAVETQDFLGAVFVCAQPNPKTGNPDVLTVRMYTPVQEILDWFTLHPHGMGDCDVIYKYSIFGNYPDYITARTNGIRIGINPGYGGGRVTDVTVFDPNVVATLGE